MYALGKLCCIPYMINNAVDFMCSSSGTGKRLDVGRSLSNTERPNKHNEEYLKTHTHISVGCTNLPYLEGQGSHKFCNNVSTHSEYCSNGVLSL